MNNRSPDNVRRVLGMPVSFAGLTDVNARLRAFEPENPNLFVPRTFGVGWSLNMGAVAVRLGLLRPDDSVPDPVDHIPQATLKALRLGPLVGTTAVVIAGVYSSQRYDHLPTNWGLTLRPTRWASGRAAMAMPVLLAAGAGLWAELATCRATEPNSKPTVDVTASAQALGVQTLSLVLITAAARQAHDPQAARILPLVGVVSAPAVSTGVLVTTVRSALRRLDRKLRRNHTQP